jgi:hypothetical protein
MRLKTCIATVIALFSLAAGAAFAADQTSVLDPETEIATARTELGNLLNKLKAGKDMSTRHGLGPQSVAAERAYANATRFFAHKEYLSTVRELNAYLNLTQVPTPKEYLASQYMLARSYEETGSAVRALRAYFRYLSAYLTTSSPDQNELTEVLRRMIPLAAGDPSAREQLGQILASVTSLELPAEVRPAVYYYAAKAAANDGSAALAQSWLEKTLAGAKDSGLKARALYMRALVAIGAKDFAKAEAHLADAVQADQDGSGSTRDLARLALARLAIQKRRPETALKHYGLVAEKGPEFKDALFESIYVHLDQKHDGEARAKAMLFLARYPDAPESLQLRTLLAYLDLRAGDTDAANASIKSADAKLGEISKWMHAKLVGQSRIDHTRLTDFVALTGQHVATMPTVKEAQSLFGRLAEAAQRLAEVRGQVRDTLYTVGRSRIADLRPYWVNRATQLSELGDALLAVGHRLAGAERHLYKESFDAIDWQKLSASETRRGKLLSPLAANRRKLAAWADYANLLTLNQDVAIASGKLRDTEAEIAAGRYLAATKKGGAGNQQKLVELQQSARKLSETIARTLEVIRKQKTEDLLNQSPHRQTKKFLTQYAVALQDEEETIRRAREVERSTAQRLLAEDASKAWKTWQFAMSELFTQLDGLDREIKDDLTGMLGELDKHEASYRQLSEQLLSITAELEAQLGDSLAYIFDQYAGAIGQRSARHRKWQADIEWMTYSKQAEAGQKLDERQSLEEQILKDHLTDLQQGVTWQWPN